MIITILISLLLLALALAIRGLLGSVDHEAGAFSGEDLKNDLTLTQLELLLSTAEDEYLKGALPRHEFYKLRRKRVSLAFKYLRLINQNLGQLMRAAQSADPGEDDRARRLMTAAIRLRVNIFIAQMYLAAQWMFPATEMARRINSPALRRGFVQAVGRELGNRLSSKH